MLYGVTIGNNENADNQIYLKWTIPDESHETAQLNRKKSSFEKLNPTVPFQSKTSQELVKYICR